MNGLEISLELLIRSAIDGRRRWEANVLGEPREHRNLLVV
jgi:hypothetical protein